MIAYHNLTVLQWISSKFASIFEVVTFIIDAEINKGSVHLGRGGIFQGW